MNSAASRIVAVLRWIGARRLVMPLTARVVGASMVREHVTFFLREITRPSAMRLYTLRKGGLKVGVRHGAHDPATMAEVFHRDDYVPSAAVERVLGDPRKIVDLGANVGYFGAFAIGRWPRSEVVAYEPDPDNVRVHQGAIDANGLGDRWRLVPVAAGAHEGTVQLAVGRAMGSFVAAPESKLEVPTEDVPIVDVMPEIAAADLVKLDTEGGEWEILLDPRFSSSPPRVIVLEYHPHLCPDADPRAAAERALERAQMRTESIWHNADGYGMLWAWREG